MENSTGRMDGLRSVHSRIYGSFQRCRRIPRGSAIQRADGVLLQNTLTAASFSAVCGEVMPATRLFAVRCRHCGAIILRVPRIRDVERQTLAIHLRSAHPSANFYAPALTRVLDHFEVRPVPPP